MQKKIIALAVAALASGAALAQSNVTIYGVADATIDSVKATGATAGTSANDYQSRSRVTSNSSYIGFKGAEDLGNGMKALFQFENGLNTENGAAGAWNNRDSYVGLTGSFGTFLMGNITGPTRALGAKLDVNTGATGIGANTALIGKIGGGSGAGAFDQRLTNAIAYVSPNFSGFTGVVGYTTGLTNTFNGAALAGKEAAGVGSTATGNTGLTMGANYDNGPIYLGYAYTQVKNTGATSAADWKLTSNRLGGIYKFGAGQVGLLWDQTKAEDSLAAGTGTADKQTAWYLTGKFNVTPAGAVIGQYGRAGDMKSSGYVANNTDTGAKHWVVGYEHSLSKRTVVKALYSKLSNDNNANYDFLYGVSAANSTASGTGLASNGANPTGFSVGVRHSF